VWFVLDTDGTFVFMTGSNTTKGKAMRRDPRVALLVDDERPPFSFVLVRGEVTISDDLEDMLPWSIRIATRYMGGESGEEFGRRNAVAGEVLVRLSPQTVIATADMTG
jgi:PPOX class probable F420-dependent enzyme